MRPSLRRYPFPDRELIHPRFSFNVTITGTTNPVVKTSCATNDYVFNPGCEFTDFGNGVSVHTTFDFVNNDDRTADLFVTWKPSDVDAVTSVSWTQMNASHRISAQEMLQQSEPGSNDFVFTYVGRASFSMEDIEIFRPPVGMM